MEVKLVSYSQPPLELSSELKNLTELVSFCARVSNPQNQLNSGTATKLIKYLIKHKHFSPLEMVNVCMEITTTRDISRQILRHRSFCFQEFSQRYADPTKELQFELREARLQDEKNRQNSIETDDSQLQAEWDSVQKLVIESAQKAYSWAISKGIAKEQARVVLPEGNTTTRMYMNGTLRSWIHYIELRKENGTQKEHMLVAKECAKVISSVFSVIEDLSTN